MEKDPLKIKSDAEGTAKLPADKIRHRGEKSGQGWVRKEVEKARENRWGS